jgi:hypothetical protein
MNTSESIRRRNWNEQWKHKGLIGGGTVPSIIGFDSVDAMQMHAKHGTPITRNAQGFLGSTHLKDYRPSSSYNKPYNTFLGTDTTDSNPTTATLTFSMLTKWIAVGVITAILSEVIRRKVWGKT